MMTFKDFLNKYVLKIKARSNIKFYQVISSISLSDIRIYLGDVPFKFDMGIVNLHPFRGTHWVIYIHECYFDSYGFSPRQKLSKFIVKRNGYCFYSEYKIQGLINERDFHCASYFLFTIYLTKVLRIDHKSAVLNLFCQMIQ